MFFVAAVPRARSQARKAARPQLLRLRATLHTMSASILFTQLKKLVRIRT